MVGGKKRRVVGVDCSISVCLSVCLYVCVTALCDDESEVGEETRRDGSRERDREREREWCSRQMKSDECKLIKVCGQIGGFEFWRQMHLRGKAQMAG